MSKNSIKSDMKNLTQQLFWVLLLLISSQLAAQDTNDTPFLKLLALPNAQADTMLLRWIVSDPETWKEAIEEGCNLSRFTTHFNGEALTGAEVQSSHIWLTSNLFPLEESDWTTQFPDNDFAKVAKGALYEADSSANLIEGEIPTLADAVNKTNANDARLAFALLAAEQDFEVAKGMALGYCDATVETGYTYIYRLAINGTDIAAAISIKADDALILPSVDSISAEGGNLAISIEWNTINTEGYYSSYTVERSTDGVDFSPLSSLPFIYASSAEAALNRAIFKDSIETNDMLYYYRVCGRTPFGTRGPFSTVVQVQGIPPRICLLYTSPSPRDATLSRMPSSA